MESNDIESAIESILFVSGEPVRLSRIAAVLGVGEFEAEAAVNRMRDKYSFEHRGIRLVKMDGSVQLCSSPEYADLIRTALETRKPPQLSQPALEVLAVVAYFQPVTKAYIEQIRGVDSVYTVGLLLDRGLIQASGRLNAPGRPVLYRTTSAFLRTFGLEALRDLPELPLIENASDESEGIQSAIIELRERESFAREQAREGGAGGAEAANTAPEQAREGGAGGTEAANTAPEQEWLPENIPPGTPEAPVL